jgi:hypothetical protein
MLCKEKESTFCGPMTRVIPERKRICSDVSTSIAAREHRDKRTSPSARRAESKNITTPTRRKKRPKDVTPTPISAARVFNCTDGSSTAEENGTHFGGLSTTLRTWSRSGRGLERTLPAKFQVSSALGTARSAQSQLCATLSCELVLSSRGRSSGDGCRGRPAAKSTRATSTVDFCSQLASSSLSLSPSFVPTP